MKYESLPLRRQVAETLRRARKLPPSPYRSDLRQLALGLLRLHRKGIRGNVTIIPQGPLN
jgi:hypothetical protein